VRTLYFRSLIFRVCLLLSASGCIATPVNDRLPNPTLGTASPQPSATTQTPSTSTPAPTQEPDFFFPSITTLEEEDRGGISILSFFVNNRIEPVTEVEIRATLQFQSNETPIQQEISLPFHHVLPSEKVPFLIRFPIQVPPEKDILEVINFQISGYQDAIIEVDLAGKTSNFEGESILYGWITNPENHPAQIHNFDLLAGISMDQPTSLESTYFHPTSILPHQSVPFLFSLDHLQDQPLESFFPFIDATRIPKLVEPSLSLPQYPEAMLDPQGNLLIRGIIQNNDQISRWVSAEVVLFYQDHIVSLTSMNPPFPLRPGEARPFGLTNFPGWRTRLDELGGQLDEISIVLFNDPLGSAEFKGQILDLTIEILGFESTGSTLLIKGTAANPSSHLLSQPAVQAEIRTTAGIVQTSNWMQLGETLPQGESIDFVLGIRLPDGIKLSDMEFDVTGSAILGEGPLPF